MTARKVQTRAKEHRTFSTAKNIYYHINSCPNYLGRLLKFEHENFKPEDKINVKKKLRDVFFMEHFTIQYSIIWLKVLIIFFVKYDQFRNYRKLKNFPVLWRRVISLKIEIFEISSI